MAETSAYRLPKTVRPRHYGLELQPDLGRARFRGTATIDVEVAEATREFVLNAAELSISQAIVDAPSGAQLSGSVSLDEAEQQAKIVFEETLPAGEGYKLHLTFEGILNDHLHGFYLSTFRDDDGLEHVIATTQFEPSDARRAFPCWDEPDFKATFSVTLVVDAGLSAFSNSAELSSETLPDGRRRVTFGQTMLMSTYLVAFVVGPYEATDPVEVDGVPLRIAAIPGRLHLTGYAEKAGVHALRFLSQYFDIPYPGDKIDHLAIPDFAFGAMENLGCVTYRENALLADADMASQVELQRIATVIAHETAHMWFGDLVTMRWWNGIWLNEAFATFMELATTEAFDPDWHVWTTFGVGKSAALATDGLRATRPVEFSVGRPEEAEAMFDVLTYLKGGAVLRMLEQYLGPETFRKGISHYLTTHAFGNTETTDLWDAIETVSGEPVSTIMDSWIEQGGHPLITAEPGDDPSSIVLRQRRFLYGGGPSAERWAVPVNLRASVNGEIQRHRILVDDTSVTFTFDGPLDWVVVNDGAWGFYRVQYSADLLSLLQVAHLTDVLDPLERLALVADTWAAVVAGIAELREWASVVESVAGDEDPDVWAAIGAVLGLLGLIANDQDKAALRAFVNRIASPVWERLGWTPDPGESRRTATARARVLAALGLNGEDEDLRREASNRYREFVDDPMSLAPDLVAVTSRIVVASGGEEAWSTVLDQYRHATVPQDKVRYLFALAEPDYAPLLSRTLDMTLGTEVRAQDAPFLIATIFAHRSGARLAWEWVEQHWDDLVGRFTGGLLIRMLEGLTSILDRDLAEAVHAFCDSHEVPGAGPRLDQLLERMDINVALAGRLRGTLEEAFAAGRPAAS